MASGHGRSQNAKTDERTVAQHRPLLNSHQEEHGSTHKLWSRWKALTTMIVFMLGGLVFVLGHHFMNHYLNGKEVTNVPVAQSWIFRFGTAFAFLVNMAFAVSVSTSYVQYQWFRFQRQSFCIDEIDSLTDVLQNGLRMFYNCVFFHQPLLLLMAIVAWTIPIATVVSPGSLTVEPARRTSIARAYVPQPYYNSTYFGQAAYDDSSAITTFPTVYKLAYNTAAAGRPVELTSEFQNETYTLTFDGPAVKCTSASNSVVRSDSLHFQTNGADAVPFVSWIPNERPSYSALFGDHPPTMTNTIDYTEGDVARIFVTTNTGTWNNTIPSSSNLTGIDAMVLNVTECQLWNATYNVDFNFQYPNQTRRVTILNWLNPVAPPTPDLGYYYNPSNTTASTRISYLCMMQAFGKLLVGYSTLTQYITNPTSVYTSWAIMDIDWSEGPAVQQGLESLFQNFTLSMLSNQNFTKANSDTEPIQATVTTFPITYAYASYELLVPYFVAFAFVFACAIIGSYACFINHASYQNIFSSFLRAIYGCEIQAALDPNDSGADPLPKDHARAKVMLGSGNMKRN